MARIRTIERGFFYFLDKEGKDTGFIQCHITIGTRVVQRSTKTLSIQKARQMRVQLLAESQRTATVAPTHSIHDALGAYLSDCEQNQKASLRTIRGHVKLLNRGLDTLRMIDPRFTDRVLEMRGWLLRRGMKPVTVNRHLQTLRAAVVMWAKKSRQAVPWVPLLDAPSGRRARYIPPADQVLLSEHLPMHVAELFELATMCGVRKGQLTRTKREYVNAELQAIEWPAEETKQRKTHFLPLDERGWHLVEAWLRDVRPWCPYLFHGAHCSPVRHASKAYGCVGDFKKAWATAAGKAGLSDVRFHDTRRTAATRLRANGADEATAMKITGHQTSYIFRQYDLGDIERVRAAMASVSEAAEQRAKERARFRK
jgi:integrase